ncbi:hypothetical protein ACQ9BO_09090 [Flavobacterium sp. P21]|uniref:hypothetical protein n=1 Tax=Flavobacterium sp. P21 TaxID=3423948 RepID=UPI003D675EE6
MQNLVNFKVYFIKKIEFSAYYIRLFDINYAKDDFSMEVNQMSSNPKGCNMNVFYLENSDNSGELYLISDSLIFPKEFIIKKYSCISGSTVVELPTVKRIM